MMANRQRFHYRTGRLIKLTNEGTRAERCHAHEEFNNGLVFSEKPLDLNEKFVVRMSKKISSWSGSIEIGLTSSNPSETELTKGALASSGSTLLISGTSVTLNGVPIKEDYCKDLDLLNVGDTVGIMQNDQSEVHVFINGTDQGIVTRCEEKVWAVVNLYGKCSSILIVSDSLVPEPDDNRVTDNVSFSELFFDSASSNLIAPKESAREPARLLLYQSVNFASEALLFFSKCGSLIRLSDGGMMAIRLQHQDEFNNGVVMTNRILRNEELFEIRINELTDKWSGSIEMGITTHAPDLLQIPSTMTNLRSGTIMLSGCGIITNGKGTRKEYLDIHLDELKVGDHIGLMRKTQGTLHFYINGVDQGVAANRIPPHVYGVVDLYGRAVSVSIVPHRSVFERNRRNRAAADQILLNPNILQEHAPLKFSSICGKHIKLSACKKTTMRQNPLEDFNHAVTLSDRTLEPGEMLTVRIEDIVDKWSGSLEIGVTTHSPESLNFPATMTNVRSGTWIMTSTGVMVNGVTVVDDYGSNMDSLAIGDKLGVCRDANGNLHFYINGVDQGLAASRVPENIYAMIDLYGQVSAASIIDSAVHEYDDNLPSSSAMDSSNCMKGFPELIFNPTRAECSVLPDDQLKVQRKNPDYYFDDCIVLVNTKLQFLQMCEFEINKIIPHWSGSLELGVTTEAALHTFPSSLTELNENIWVWTGKSTFENGCLLSDALPCDTEDLKPGSRIGFMLSEKGLLGYFDGVDIGVLFPNIKKDVFPVINLYGKCAQVTLVGKKRFSGTAERKAKMSQELLELPAYTVLKNNHRFYDYTSGEFVFLNDQKVALRRPVSLPPMLFSEKRLKIGEIFEILINDTHIQCGSIVIGLASLEDVGIRSMARNIQTVQELEIHRPTCLIAGNGAWIMGQKVKDHYFPELYCVDYNDRIGVVLYNDESLVLFFNGKKIGKIPGAFMSTDLPHFVLYMGERVRSLEVVDNTANIKEMKSLPSLSDSSSEEELLEVISRKAKDVTMPIASAICTLAADLCGKNVRIIEDGFSATRVGSYNQGLVVTDKPLCHGAVFQVKVKSLNGKWKSSLSIGVTGVERSEMKLTVDALKATTLTWLIRGDSVFKNGAKIKENYGPMLDMILVSQVVGICVDVDRNLHLYVDGKDQGIAATNMPETCYGIVDMYGNCDEIEVVKEIEQKTMNECDQQGLELAVTVTRCENLIPESVERLCSILDLSKQYIKTLGIPTDFFTGAWLCFCQTCSECMVEPVQKRQGEPPHDYTQPMGWCKFTLRTHPNVDFPSVSKYWNLAFYATNFRLTRKLLDCGEIPIPCSHVFDLRNTKIDEDGLAVISPDIKFACNEKLVENPVFIDTASGMSYRMELAFQVYIQPYMFKKINPAISNIEKLEWITKEPGTTILSHLLIKAQKLE